jgi:hypothetical protein
MERRSPRNAPLNGTARSSFNRGFHSGFLDAALAHACAAFAKRIFEEWLPSWLQGTQWSRKLRLVPKRRAYDEMIVSRKNSNHSDIGTHDAVS